MRKHAVLGAAVTALALVTAACSTSSRSQVTADGGGTPGVTDTGVKVGGINTATTAFGFSMAGAELGARARFDRANAEGGVNGRRIEFVGVRDDNGDQAKNLAAARRLVQQDQVFAVVPVEVIAFGGAGFLRQNNVPYVGWGFLPEFCGVPVAFGYNGCTLPQKGQTGTSPFNALAKALGGAEGRTVAAIGNDDPTSKTALALYTRTAETQGFKVVTAQNTLPQRAVPTDWSPFVRTLMTSDGGHAPDVIYSQTSAAFNTGLFSALKAAGFRGALMESISYRDSLLQNPQTRAAYQGAYLSAQIQPLVGATPAARQMKADLEKAAGGGLTWTQDMAIGYASADTFLAILKAAGRDLTRAGFVQAARNLTIDNPIGGPIGFPAGSTGTNDCASLVRVDGARFTLAADLICGPYKP